MNNTEITKVILDHYGPMTASTYDEIAKKYFWAYPEVMTSISTEAVYGRFGSEGKFKNFSKILDLGIGTGNLSFQVLNALQAMEPIQSAGELIGLDSSPHMMEMAQKKLAEFPNKKFSFIQGKIEDTPSLFSNTQFDLIISAFAIHHLSAEGKEVLIKNLYNLLAPGGLLIIGDRMPPAAPLIQREEDYHRVIASKFVPLFAQTKFDPELLQKTMTYLREGFRDDGDSPSPVEEHLNWMEKAGFLEVRQPFYSFGCAVVSGVKKSLDH